MGLNKSKINEQAPINEIVGLLNTFGEGELSKLKEQYPEYSEMLKPGLTLGEEDIKDELKELKIRATICKTGLNLILGKANGLLPKIKSKLKLLNNVQFISQIIVAISGASILIFLQEKYEDTTRLAVGTLTLFAGLLSLFVQHKSGTTDYKLNAEHFLEELIIIERLDFSSSKEQVSQIIQKSNEISLQMKKIIQKY